MENLTEHSIDQLNAIVNFLVRYTDRTAGKILYDAMLHLQNTPDATVEHAINYIEHMAEKEADKVYELEQEEAAKYAYLYNDELPF